jgi:hypothetical protein
VLADPEEDNDVMLVPFANPMPGGNEATVPFKRRPWMAFIET